jgi:3-hydroxyacyl-[acyl-carrier-protein] dehydratase
MISPHSLESDTPKTLNADTTFELRFPADHPALPGHFPEQPIVPGALVLATVIAGLEQRGTGTITTIKKMRFTQPLLPEQTLTVHCTEKPSGLSFDCCVDSQTIAKGLLGVAS